MTSINRARRKAKEAEEKADTILKIVIEKPYTLAIVLPVIGLALYGFISLVS